MKCINEKPEIDYPCRWLYKIISIHATDMAAVVEEIVAESDYSLSHSNTSRTGKYVSYDLEVTVQTEEARNFFFAALKQHPSIKMVL